MPMYEYVCDSCLFEFERVQSFHDQPLTECPECGGAVRRIISSVGIIFKGSGWYITDSRRQISSTASKTDGNGKPESAPVAADAEPAAKAGADDASSTEGKVAGDRGAATDGKAASKAPSKPTPSKTSGKSEAG